MGNNIANAVWVSVCYWLAKRREAEWVSVGGDIRLYEAGKSGHRQQPSPDHSFSKVRYVFLSVTITPCSFLVRYARNLKQTNKYT